MMTMPAKASETRPGVAFALIAGLTVATAAVLIAIGYAPTLRLVGATGIPAMLAAIGITAAGSLLGAIPPVVALQRDGMARHNAILLGMTIRMFATMLLAAALGLSGLVVVKPLLLWTAIAYLAFLGVDTGSVAWLLKRNERKP